MIDNEHRTPRSRREAFGQSEDLEDDIMEWKVYSAFTVIALILFSALWVLI